MDSPQPTKSSPIRSSMWAILFQVISAEWVQVLLQAWQLLQKITTERAIGLYDVLDFEHTLELCDGAGKKAIYHKRETIKLLQDYVAAYTDSAWGRGQIFAAYRCSPGVAVDRYQSGHKYYVLISLREVKRRGDTLRIGIDRTVKNGFDVSTGWSETQVSHRTHHFRTVVIFPKERLPQGLWLIEANRNRTTPLGDDHIEILPDGRHKVTWETPKPKLFETYTLKWTW